MTPPEDRQIPEEDAKSEGIDLRRMTDEWICDGNVSPQAVIDLRDALSAARAEADELRKEVFFWKDQCASISKLTARDRQELDRQIIKRELALQNENSRLRNELENAKQDHAQADTDIIRALNERNELHEENRRLREWRTVDSSPYDFSTVIIFPDTDGRVGFATYFPSEGFQSDHGREWPTHWRPLPAAPESKGGEDE